MNPNIREKINELKNDRLHGASWLSIQAIHIVGLAIQENSATTVSQFINEMETTATAIMNSRPSMASIANYISQLLYQINTSSRGQKQLNYIQSAAQSKVVELVKLMQEATLKAAQNGATMINDQDTIITCSYSSTVCATFKIAQERAIKFEVLVAESKYNSTKYGEISAEQIRLYQIPVTVITDASIKQYVNKANKALVGADTIGTDGSLVNGTPTYKLAQEAAVAKIPLYPICETAKFDVLAQRLKSFHLEPGFDLIPPYLVTGFITEAGIIKPNEVSNFKR